jgi:hypothetical protein
VNATAPLHSEFEIEAKIGNIVSQDTNERIELPVMSEAIFNKNRFGPTRFASTMSEVCASVATFH